MIHGPKARLFGLAAILLTSVAANAQYGNAQYGRDSGQQGMVEYSRQTGGYCDRSGCPDRFWRYRIYYGPVYYHGKWFRGPIYVKDDYGRNLFWVEGGWHRDQWHGGRPIWARYGHFGPPLSRDYYQANNFGDRGRDADSNRRPQDWRDSQGYRDSQPQDASRDYGESRRYGDNNGPGRNDVYSRDRQDYGARDDRRGYAPQDGRQTQNQYDGGGGVRQDQRAQDGNRQDGYRQYGQGGRNNADPRSANGGPTSFTDQNPPAQGGRGQSLAQGQQSTISVTSATYGGSCKAPKGNVTQPLQNACNGKATCQYMVSVSVLGDPARGCPSDFVVEWTCGTGPGSSASLPGEASGNKVNLTCLANGR